MRLVEHAVRGYGPFVEEARVRLDTLPGPIVAVKGANGSGKTCWLEGILGAAYRKTPSRGIVSAMATARDSLIETTIEFGEQRFTVKQIMDAHTDGAEALVLRDGEPVLEGTKVSAYKAWAEQTWPPFEITCASLFGSQASNGILDSKDGDRRKLLLRALGIEHLEALAKGAREHAAAEQNLLELQIAKLEQLGTVDLEGAEQAIADARVRAELEDRTLEGLRVQLDGARAAQAERDRVLGERCRIEELRVEVDKRVSGAREEQASAATALEKARPEVEGLEERIQNNRNLLEHPEPIEQAHAEFERLGAELGALDAQRDAARAEQSAAANRETRAKADAAACRSRAEKRRGTLPKLREDVARAEKGTAAVEHLPAREADLEAAKAQCTVAEQELEDLRGQQLLGVGERIAQLRYGLEVIATDETANAQVIAREELAADDQAVELAATLPKSLQAAQERVHTATALVSKCVLTVGACRELAALAPRLEEDRRALDYAEDEIRLEERAALEFDSEAIRETESQEYYRLDVERLTAQMTTAQQRRADVETLAKRKQYLDQAEMRIADLEEQLAPARERLAAALERDAKARQVVERAQAERDALPELPELPEAGEDPQRLDGCIATQEGAARAAHAAIAVAEQALEQTRQTVQRIEEAQTERRRIEEELADWRRLADDLGKGGLQSAEIDNAGPELTELVNDLVETCIGSRYSVRIETTRMDASGKKELDGLPIIVTDSVTGYEGDARGFSGGQKALIGEAIALALTMVVTRRAGFDGVTLIRDETAAALDPENARSYVAMLRRAAELVGADRVLFVSHNPETWELADSRLEVADGRITIS